MSAPNDIPFDRLILLTAAPTAAVSYLTAWLMRYISPKLRYLDHPGGRKIHTRTTPLGGGVAIMAAMFIVILGGLAVVFFGLYQRFHLLDGLAIHRPGVITRLDQIGGVLLAALILHVLGLFDDIKNLGPAFKLIVQFAVAALVVFGFGVRVYMFLPIPLLGCLLSIFWIVVVTNAFNFLDNIDGLSAGVALVCTTVLLAVAVSAGQVFVAAYLACLAAALFGFLLHNLPPARLFLGDAGSLPIGFLLAVGSILTTYYQEHDPAQAKTAVLIPLVVMAIPLYDFLSVLYLRFRSRQSLFVGDHRHFSHRLICRGFSVRTTVATIYLACAGTAVAAIVLQHVAWPYAILLFLQTICIVAIIALLEYQGQNDDPTQQPDDPDP